VRPPLSARTSSRRHRIDTRYIALALEKVPGRRGALDLYPSWRSDRTEIRRGRCQ
jgi:hypothetical protein